jgi:probable HAF family extracellular repeat protein
MKTSPSQFHKTRLSLFAALAITLSGGVMAQSMTDLGTLGGTSGSARGVSADGSVIVGDSATASSSYAFKYVGTTMTSLGALGGGAYSNAWGVSSDGKVIVGDSDSTGNLLHAFKYVGTTMTDLGTFGGSYSSARAASADGSVIVGGSQYPNSDVHAFKYVGTTMTSLGTLGGDYSFASSVSADGSVIVGESRFSPTSFSVRAFKYVGTTMTDLGTLGGSESKAWAVSADGAVIVGQSDTTGDAANHAFKYVGTTMTSLGTLGGLNSIAWAVSADGKVIVGESYTTGDAAIHAFKYVGTTMTSLGTLGGDYSSARGVSADGKVIVGESTTVSGDIHAFVYNNTVDSGVLVDVNNTYSSIAINSYQLNSLLNAQNTALVVNLNSDCTVFGANNVCVGIGGRYTNVSSPTSSQTAGNIQVGYRFDPSFRAGVFLDQGISNTTPNNYTVKNSQPLAGLFAVYAPRGNNLGVQVKASAAYSSNGVNITRTTLSNTEAGQGTSTMTTQGAQLETAYGFVVGDRWIASPLVGVRATSVVRNSYTETAGATFPITYNSVSQTATTAYAGAKVMGYVTPKVSVGASAGVEQDLSSNISNYSGSIYYLGAFSLAAPSISQTRPFAAANADYWIEKNQRVSLGAYYNKQSLNTSNGITAMLNYTIGL